MKENCRAYFFYQFVDREIGNGYYGFARRKKIDCFEIESLCEQKYLWLRTSCETRWHDILYWRRHSLIPNPVNQTVPLPQQKMRTSHGQLGLRIGYDGKPPHPLTRTHAHTLEVGLMLRG